LAAAPAGFFFGAVGAMMVIIVFPSIFGADSTFEMSAMASTMCFNTSKRSGRRRPVPPAEPDGHLDLVPSSRKRRICLSFVFRSCSSVLGRTLISLTWMTVCFFLASCSRLLVMYLNFRNP